VNQKIASYAQNVRIQRGAAMYLDHYLVLSKIAIEVNWESNLIYRDVVQDILYVC